MKYAAINIGPILDTLALARKPRELWSASYLFSYLMKAIFEEVESAGGKIISPAKIKSSYQELAVGLYPDRIFFIPKGGTDIPSLCKMAETNVLNSIPGIPKRYFNIMSVEDEFESEKEAISGLNRHLDILELYNHMPPAEYEKSILSVIKAQDLYTKATGKYTFKVESIYDISKKYSDSALSLSRYYCIVQADGDNMGKLISNPSLKEGEVNKISQALLDFGVSAAREIDDFGGMPIYAGGDDLLFIAPVIGKDEKSILDLVETLDNVSFGPVKNLGIDVQPSLSFGISCQFVKFPLYEALESARNLLFGKAKHYGEKDDSPGPKNAISWQLRKHSGGTFSFTFSMKESDLFSAFKQLIAAASEEDLVSALAHKIRAHEVLLENVVESGQENRLNALFEHLFEAQDNNWYGSVKTLIPALKASASKTPMAQDLYAMLRTARFIHGEPIIEQEELIDE